MRKLVIIETVEELMAVAGIERPTGDTTPCLPDEAKLHFDFVVSPPEVVLEAQGFELSEELQRDPEGVIRALAHQAGFFGIEIKTQTMRGQET